MSVYGSSLGEEIVNWFAVKSQYLHKVMTT